MPMWGDSRPRLSGSSEARLLLALARTPDSPSQALPPHSPSILFIRRPHLSLAANLKSATKRLTPTQLRRFLGEYLAQRRDAKQQSLPVEQIFSALYQEKRWEVESPDDFSSGSGSRVDTVVFPYVNAVRKFLASQPTPPSVVDLGCGDFQVGAQLRPYCARYIACDVVPALIERNKKKFAAAQVEFRCLNIIDDDLPPGDIVFLRQVLQHLNNAQIARIVPKLSRYKFLILTEHLPAAPNFSPNRDKPAGGGTRLPQKSGVVLTAPPFLLKPKSESILCTIPESIANSPGLITSTLYELGP
jgi:SAM-dependent methyltransferase